MLLNYIKRNEYEIKSSNDFFKVEYVKSQPLVSVVLPTFNRESSINRAIQSVINQTYKRFELIVVDDGSTDSTENVVKKTKDQRIKYIKFSENYGAATARNEGVQQAQGDYVAFQDSDDEWMPNKLERQMSCFALAANNVGMVYTDMLRIFENGKTTVLFAPNVVKGKIMDKKELEYQAFGIGQVTAVIRKNCFDSVGYFDSSLPRFIDMEFFLRLTHQFDAIRINTPLVRCYESEGISSNKANGVKVRLRFLEKYKDSISTQFKASQYAKIAELLFSLRQYRLSVEYLFNAFQLSPGCITIWKTGCKIGYQKILGNICKAPF
ncbi:MAG: glycosyltransferase [Chitinivibrionales bacterium]|nr:glycosyltransferase [Chitinivibrionales bacterium]